MFTDILSHDLIFCVTFRSLLEWAALSSDPKMEHHPLQAVQDNLTEYICSYPTRRLLIA
jgi:hypothetical protein